MEYKNYRNVTTNLYDNKVKVKIRSKKILILLFLLFLLNYWLYKIIYWDINNSYYFIVTANLYWILFFNNILIVFTILQVYYIFKENIIIKQYKWQEKKKFSDDWKLLY